MNILLVEPNYYTKYPPLGLLKIASYHREKGDNVQLVKGSQWVSRYPDIIYFTSLFTYAWKPVHEAINFYKQMASGLPPPFASLSLATAQV